MSRDRRRHYDDDSMRVVAGVPERGGARMPKGRDTGVPGRRGAEMPKRCMGAARPR